MDNKIDSFSTDDAVSAARAIGRMIVALWGLGYSKIPSVSKRYTRQGEEVSTARDPLDPPVRWEALNKE